MTYEEYTFKKHFLLSFKIITTYLHFILGNQFPPLLVYVGQMELVENSMHSLLFQKGVHDMRSNQSICPTGHQDQYLDWYAAPVYEELLGKRRFLFTGFSEWLDVSLGLLTANAQA